MRQALPACSCCPGHSTVAAAIKQGPVDSRLSTALPEKHGMLQVPHPSEGQQHNGCVHDSRTDRGRDKRSLPVRCVPPCLYWATSDRQTPLTNIIARPHSKRELHSHPSHRPRAARGSCPAMEESLRQRQIVRAVLRHNERGLLRVPSICD